ncbi:MAG: DEAD/DEAH box helicase [Bacteroidales bacterium]
MKINDKYKLLEEYFPEILTGIDAIIQKGKIAKRFSKLELTNDDIEKLIKAKEITELKIIELQKEQDSPRFKQLCSIYFDIATLLLNDLKTDEDIYELVKTIAFGYLGEHHHLVRDYLIQKKDKIWSMKVPKDWNERLFIQSVRALVSLVIKKSWHDIEESIKLINNLRIEQKDFEDKYLNKIKEESQPYGAAEIVSLYHFAKIVDLIGQYLLEGKLEDASYDVENKIEYHIKIAKELANASGNIMLELLYQYFEAFGKKLVRNTIWYSLNGINHWVSAFNKFIAKRENHSVFELLYPQRESIIKGELLNPIHKSIVVCLPTSSGKTLIAEYKILQALNEFKEQGGWVAYIVPTKTLVNQIYARLNFDLGHIGLKVEKASGAIEIDGFESYLVENKGDNTDFDVLVTTYEKLNLLIRQGLGTTPKRPLVLTIVDEAHNLEERQRGLNLELLLATIKNDCQENKFILLTPDIPNASTIANWLGGDRSKLISVELDWWQPNERIIGALRIDGRGKNFDVYLQTLNTIKGTYQIADKVPLIKKVNADVTKSDLNSKLKLSSFVASEVLDINSPVIILASGIDETYKIAEYVYSKCNQDFDQDSDVELIKKFIQTELGEDFPLSEYLNKRIAIHSSAIPDEIRQLIEGLMVEGKIHTLVATTTIAQGINFPVSTVIMGSYNYPLQGAMPTKDFWNLAGRVGRVGQTGIGWVGIVCRNDSDLKIVSQYVQQASGDLLSQLESVLETAMKNPDGDFTRLLYYDERWSALLQYISHLRLQVQDLNIFINNLKEKLNGTLGFKQISEEKKKFLFNKLKEYVKNLSLDDAKQADATGFSTISIRQMIGRLSQANISPNDWKKHQLFSQNNETMKKLVGIMLNTYEIRKSIEEIKIGDKILDQRSISNLIINWVNGQNISEISDRTFPNEENKIKAIEKTTKAIYKVIANMASWGISAIQKMPTSGIDWNYLSDVEKKKMMNIPAYLFYGVNTDEGVLMRKANVPRSIANQLGAIYKEQKGDEIYNVKISSVNNWLKNSNDSIWEQSLPSNSRLSGIEFRKIWEKLNNA